MSNIYKINNKFFFSLKKMTHQSKFCIPKPNQNTFSMPKAKVKDFSPIDYYQYFPNKEYLNDVKIKLKEDSNLLERRNRPFINLFTWCRAFGIFFLFII